MNEKQLTTKPVFEKYSWPPKRTESIKSDVPINKLIISDIYRTESSNLDLNDNFTFEKKLVANTLEERATTNSGTTKTDSNYENTNSPQEVANEKVNDEEPRKSFQMPDDSDTYEAKVQKIINKNGAASKLLYLCAVDTERLTGPQALNITIDNYMKRKVTTNYDIDFLVNKDGITLTDEKKRKFFRKHFAYQRISYCDLITEYQGVEIVIKGMFAFVVKAKSGKSNECHLFRELHPSEPARSIVNFINIAYQLHKIEIAKRKNLVEL